MFDGVEIWGIGWHEAQGVSGSGDGLFNVGAFVECGVVHDHNGGGRKLRHKVLLRPCRKHICINRGGKQADGEQGLSQQGPNHIGAPAGVPVLYSVTPLSFVGVTMRAGHVVSKAALVNVNNRAPLCLILCDGFLKALPCGVVRLGVPQCFFYR